MTQKNPLYGVNKVNRIDRTLTLSGRKTKPSLVVWDVSDKSCILHCQYKTLKPRKGLASTRAEQK